jgi:hypothetical protein
MKEVKMERVCEFEVWSKPGALLPTDYGKELQRELVANGELAGLGIPDDVFIGLSNIPDKIDIYNLKIDIDAGHLSVNGFIDFCHEHGFEPRLDSALSACKYLEYSFGCPIAWVHIPESREDEILPVITRLMHERGFMIKQ